MKTTSPNREAGQAPALKISALTVQAGHGAARRPVFENISFEVYPVSYTHLTLPTILLV